MIVRIRLFVLAACMTAAAAISGEAEEKTPVPARRVVVYYLHNTWRCPGCNSVESLAKAAVLGGKGENSKAGTEIEVEPAFAGDVKAGRLTFVSVNVDDKKNKPLAKALGQAMKVPVVAEYADKKIASVLPLDKAWSHLNDNEAFVLYVREGLLPVLKKVRPKDEAGKADE